MRVTNQLISTLNACNANKTIEVLKKENKEKMLNYLDIPNNCIFSLSHNTITLSFLTVYVLMQCVARDSVSTKDLLIVPFVFFVLLIVFFSYILIETMLTSMAF